MINWWWNTKWKEERSVIELVRIEVKHEVFSLAKPWLLLDGNTLIDRKKDNQVYREERKLRREYRNNWLVQHGTIIWSLLKIAEWKASAIVPCFQRKSEWNRKWWKPMTTLGRAKMLLGGISSAEWGRHSGLGLWYVTQNSTKLTNSGNWVTKINVQRERNYGGPSA